MRKPATKAIVFDFDGVLVDTVDIKTRAFVKLYERYGDVITERVKEYHLRNGGMSRHEKFHYFHEHLLGRILTREKETLLAEAFAGQVIQAVVEAPWIPGAHEFLEKFHQRVIVFVASGTPEEELKEIIGRRKMTHYFKAVHGAPATKGEIIRQVITENHLRKDQVLMVGDAATDYEGAEKAGVRFIGKIDSENRYFPEETELIRTLFELEGKIDI